LSLLNVSSDRSTHNLPVADKPCNDALLMSRYPPGRKLLFEHLICVTGISGVQTRKWLTCAP